MNNPLFHATSNTSQVPDFHKCQTLALLLPMGWAGTSLAPPLEAEAGQSQPFPSPPEITTTAVAAGGFYCSRTTLKALECQVSSHLQFLTRLCLFIILNACWRFLAPELLGQELFFMLLHGHSCSVSQLSRREEITSYTIWTALKFGFILKLCPKTIILAYFKFLVRFFFPPHERKQVEIITKLTWDKKITDTETGLRKRRKKGLH